MMPRLLSTLALIFSVSLGCAGAMAAAPLKIGVGGPMTGSDAEFGIQMRNGVEQAVHDINAGGGILGRNLSVAIGDDAGDPKQGVSVAKKFVAGHVRFVIGHFNSGVTLPTSSIYAANSILDITPSATNPQITERGLATVFRICGRDDSQPGVAAAFVAGLGGKKIAILHDKTTYGKDFADAFRKALAVRGIKEVLYDGANKDRKIYSSLIARIKASDAELVYWGGGPAEAGLIVKQMRERGIKAVMVASDAIASDEFPAVGGDAVEGTYMTFPPDPRQRPQAAKVVQEFKARGIDPETYTLYAYAAVEVIKQAADAAHSLDPMAIAQTMHSGMHFSTVLGDIAFDAKGDATRPDYVMFVWKKGLDGKIGYYPIKP
jgi:branched-chain amino acid transport system substrate-binding protein